MLQPAVYDCGPLDAVSFGEDRLGSSKIDVSGREVVDALVIADVVIMLDEGVDLLLEIAGQILVVEQDAVLQGLVPSLDLSLGLGMIRGAAYVLHVLAFEPLGQIARDVTRSIVAQKPGPLRSRAKKRPHPYAGQARGRFRTKDDVAQALRRCAGRKSRTR